MNGKNEWNSALSLKGLVVLEETMRLVGGFAAWFVTVSQVT